MMDVLMPICFAVVAALLGAAVAVIFLLNKNKSKGNDDLIKRIEKLETMPRVTREDIKSLDSRITALEQASISQGTKITSVFKKFMNLENLVKRGGNS